MRTLVLTNPFKRDWNKIKHSGRYSAEVLRAATDLLCNDLPLPERMHDHALSGQWAKISARECHVKPDLLLVYAKPDNELHLLRLTSHSELF
jgi:mRNA interferase YafQ